MLKTLVVAFGIFVIGMSHHTSAQGNTANGTLFDDWRLGCQATAVNQTSCAIEQGIANTDTGNLIAKISFQLVKVEDVMRTVLVLNTPTNMLLTTQPGYRVGDDEGSTPLVWRTCSPQSCTASRVLEDEEIGRLSAGGKMTLGYQLAGQAQPLVFQASLNGVAAGLNALAQ